MTQVIPVTQARIDLLEEETIYTLEHSMDDIRKAEEEIARGEYITLEELKKELAERKANRNKIHVR